MQLIQRFSLGLVACGLMLVLPGCFDGSVEKADFLVINVLDKPDCMIKGSINVSFAGFENYIQQQLSKGALDRDTEIVVYCSNYLCSASGMAWRYLQEQGFSNCWAYEAGMAAWYQAELPVEGACKSTYLLARNEPLGAHESYVRVISTEQLRQKMEQHVYNRVS